MGENEVTDLSKRETKGTCLVSPHSGTSNSFVGKSNHHCHGSAFPIKPAQSPSWSGPCRRSLLSPKKTPRRFISTAEEVKAEVGRPLSGWFHLSRSLLSITKCSRQVCLVLGSLLVSDRTIASSTCICSCLLSVCGVFV